LGDYQFVKFVENVQISYSNYETDIGYITLYFIVKRNVKNNVYVYLAELKLQTIPLLEINSKKSVGRIKFIEIKDYWDRSQNKNKEIPTLGHIKKATYWPREIGTQNNYLAI
jgi:hypothetical protein